MKQETNQLLGRELDPRSWELVIQIFDAALDMPASERGDFLRHASQGNSQIYSAARRLLEGHAKAGDFLETPARAEGMLDHFASASPPFHPGQTIAERFRVLRRVGEGGMGHVFEAWDIVLKRQVALKTIHPEIATHPESQERFYREVSLALKITHPNVCRTFDIGKCNYFPESNETTLRENSPQEVLFLTMEFLEGETLAAKLSRDGPQTLSESLSIARQIAAGLAAAHQLSIVHRDIKPGNIMLLSPAVRIAAALPSPVPETPSDGTCAERPRAVITDFGLAREQSPLTAADGLSVSHTGLPLGTLAYMAPEQLEGHAVNAATDVYAFGLVLFEMVTGKRAFSSANPLSDLKQRLSGPPPSPLAVVPELPPNWCRAIEGCLTVNLAERFQSATEAMAILEGAQSKHPIAAAKGSDRFWKSLSGFLLPNWSIRGRLIVLATISLAAVSLFVGGLRLYLSRADSTVAPGALIYLTDVKNQTGDKALDNLTALIQAGLAQSVQINLLDQGRVGDILQQMEKTPGTVIDDAVAREIALRAGAVRVVFAKMVVFGGKHQLQVEIQQPDAGSPSRIRDRRTRTFEWQSPSVGASTGTVSSELSHAIRESSNWIRYEVGESANDIARLDVPPEDVTTRNWTALSDYSHAEQLVKDDQLDGAAIELTNAVREDQHFALAYGRLGDILLSLHRDIEGYGAYDKALTEARQDRLTRKEEDRIRGMRAEDTADYQLAIEAFRDLSVYYKNDYLGWVYPTVPLRMLGRDQEAIANLRRAIALDPNRAFGPFALSQELMITGDFAEVPRWISQLKEHGYPDEANEIQATLSLLNHRYDEAGATLRSSNGHAGQQQSNSNLRKLGRLAAERGDFQSAITLLNQGFAIANSQSDAEQRAALFLDQAYVEYKLQDFRKCIDDVGSGVRLSSSPEVLLSAGDLLGNVFAVAPLTLTTSIRRALEEIEQRLPAEDYGTVSVLLRLRTHGEVLLARGETRSAVELFRNASRKDAPASSRDYLGRGLIALAAREQDSQTKRTLLAEAVGALSVISERPALVWCNWLGFPPGFYADQLESYLKVSMVLGTSDLHTSRASDALATLRPGSRESRQIPAVQPATISTSN